ncbi:photosystem I assembly protein Ycf3 [Clostridioides difficile]|nr:photosystem I assembly protein Ycf3 [Clostridioides difficile]CZR83174.1 photosystem I assembly protein Ycf3 [Clostridioides difficile]
MKFSIYEKYGKKIVDIKNFVPSCDNIIIMGGDFLMDRDHKAFLCAGIALAIFFFLLLFLNEKDDKFKALKKITLVAMVSTGLFISLYLVFGYSGYETDEDDAGIAILGVLATVWVGLNIYNVIEKKEIENMQVRIEGIMEKVDNAEEKLDKKIYELDKKILEAEKRVFIEAMVSSINIEPEYYKKLDYAKKIITKYPSDDIGYLETGIICYNAGHRIVSIGFIEDALNINDKNSRSYLFKGKIFKDEGQIDKALDNFSISIKLDEKNQDAYFNIGEIYLRKRMYIKAIENSTKAIDLRREDVDVYMCRGIAYKNMGNYDEAIADIEQAKKLFNEYNTSCKYNKETIEKNLKEVKEKIENLNE